MIFSDFSQEDELVSWLEPSPPAPIFSPQRGHQCIWMCRGRWDQIADLVVDAYRVVAPKKLVAELDARETR